MEEVRELDGGVGVDGGCGLDGILVAAHELKGPLATLRQLAFSLSAELDDGDEKVRGEMINVAERAIRQVNDLTKLTRYEAGLFEMEPVSVRGVCDEVVRELEYLFRYHQRDLGVRYVNRARLVTANREMLYSVIYNFILNAMHYSGEGTRAEVSVRDVRGAVRDVRGAVRDVRGAVRDVRGAVRDVRGEVRDTWGAVRVEVRDYGPELPVTVWREMRRGFLRQPESVAMRPGSSGLGLFIASRFSRVMGAEVGAIRHRDGTSFYVELPASRQMELF